MDYKQAILVRQFQINNFTGHHPLVEEAIRIIKLGDPEASPGWWPNDKDDAETLVVVK